MTTSLPPGRTGPAPSPWAGGVAALLLVVVVSVPGAGQEPGAWGLELGGGGGILLSGHDHSVEHQLSPVARAALERKVGGAVSVVLEWAATWPSSRIAGGSEKRHHLGVGLGYRPWAKDRSGDGSGAGGPVLSLTLGPGIGTVVTQDGPPDPPAMGDAVISVGDTMGGSLAAGAGWGVDVGGLIVTPRLGLLLQRVDGHTLSHGLLTLGVGAGG